MGSFTNICEHTATVLVKMCLYAH